MIARKKRLLDYLGLRKTSLMPQLPAGPHKVDSENDCIRLDVRHLERGLYFFSIRHQSDFPLTGPRLKLAGPGFETTDHIYTFVRRDQREFFGTVKIIGELEAIHFYPSRLPCELKISSFTLRNINEFARDYVFGQTFVRVKIFGPRWTWNRTWQEIQDWLSRALKGGGDDSYGTWWRFYGELSEADLERRRRIAAAWLEETSGSLQAPRVSIILPVYRPPVRYLREAIASVQRQVYPKWQLCICDDGSGDPCLAELLASLRGQDSRIRLISHGENRGVSAASSSALSLADGDYVGFLDHDDLLAPDALFEVVAAIRRSPELVLIYSDEDLIDAEGEHLEPQFKPDWNFDLARAVTFPRHFLVARRETVTGCGGLRAGYDGAQDLDLILRLTEALDRTAIHHIPRVLYHWRAVEGSLARDSAAKPYAFDAGVKAIADHIARMALPATALKAEIPMTYRVQYAVPEPAPKVSIIVPTRDNLRVLRNCIDSLLERTTYPEFEIIVVDNRSEDPDTLAYLDALSDGSARVLRFDSEFNFAAINNYAVEHSAADILVLLNNDTEVCNGDWLDEMVSQASRPGIGAVGAKLFYAEDYIQHAGVLLGMGPDRVAGHAFKGFHKHEVGPLARTRLAQEYHAVTAACMAVARSKYLEVGGLDAENLPIAFNDVDFCLKLLDAGYLNLWTPYAQLYHYESYTRGYDVTAEKRARFLAERDYMHERWAGRLGLDRYYNPNLSRDFDNFCLAWPPEPTASEELR